MNSGARARFAARGLASGKLPVRPSVPTQLG